MLFVNITPMKNTCSPFLKRTSFFISAFLILSGISIAASTLTDIETAVIQENYPTAETLAKQFIDQKPYKKDLDYALYYLALSELRQENYADAASNFSLLLSGFPKEELRDKAYLGYIEALYLSGEYAEGLKIAEEFLKESPNSAFLSAIYLKLGRGNLKLRNWQNAQEYLNKVVRDFPESPEAHSAKQLLDEKQYFSVQIGAFLERFRAENLVSELKKKGEYAYIVETVDNLERKFYRVRVGKAALLEEAQKLESKLAQSGYPTIIYP